MSEEKTCLTSLWRDEDDLWEATEHRSSFPSKREINTFHSNTCLKSHSGDKLTSALTHLPACYSDALCGNVTLLIILLQCMWWPSQLCIWGWHMEKEQINTLCFGFREKQNINQLKNEDTSITIKPFPSYILPKNVLYLFRHFISGKKSMFLLSSVQNMMWFTLQCVQNITLHCCEVLSYFSSFSPVCMCRTTDTQRTGTTHTLHNNYA